MTHRACRARRSFSLSPTARPATLSSCPKYCKSPVDRQASMPDGGRPRDAGRLGLGDRSLHRLRFGQGHSDAVGLIADRVPHQVGLVGGVGVAGGRQVEPSLSAAAWAPLRTRSQKASPSPPWVTMTIFIRSAPDPPAPSGAEPSSSPPRGGAAGRQQADGARRGAAARRRPGEWVGAGRCTHGVVGHLAVGGRAGRNGARWTGAVSRYANR